MIGVKCEECGTEFNAWHYQVDVGHGRFCSRSCANLWKKRTYKPRIVASQRLIRDMGTHCELPVGKSHWMKVSPEDAEPLYKTYWSYSGGYAATSYYQGALRAHREVLALMLGRKLERKEVVDHKNHDTLDNRRENLRMATMSTNNINRRIFRSSSSKYRGVSFCRQTGKWRVMIGGKESTGKQLRIGRYDDEEYAASIYDQWAIELFDDFALTNFDYVEVA